MYPPVNTLTSEFYGARQLLYAIDNDQCRSRNAAKIPVQSPNVIPIINPSHSFSNSGEIPLIDATGSVHDGGKSVFKIVIDNGCVTPNIDGDLPGQCTFT